MNAPKLRAKTATKKVVLDYDNMSEEEMLIECIRADSAEQIDQLMNDFPTFDVNFDIYSQDLLTAANTAAVTNDDENVVEGTPFSLAVQLKSLASAQCLLNYNAEINPTSIKGGHSVLHLAVMNNDIDMVKFLLNIEIVHPTKSEIRKVVERERRNDQGKTAIQLAVEQYNAPLVDLLMQKGIPFDFNARNEHGRILLHEAALNGDIKMLSCLAQLNQDMNQVDEITGQTILHYAAIGQRKDVFDFYLKRKVDSAFVALEDRNGDSALTILINNDSMELVKLMTTKMEADIHQIFLKDGLTIVHRAARNNDKTLLDKLLSSLKAKISVTDQYGNTPLHSAIVTSSVDTVKLLVEKKAEVTTPNKFGNTPIHYAAYFGNGEILQLLLSKLDKKATANVENLCKRNPLHEAAMTGHVEQIKPLLSKGVNIHAEDCNDMTALQIAINCQHVPFSIELIHNGAKAERPYRRMPMNEEQRDVNFEPQQGARASETEEELQPYNTILQQAICHGYGDLVSEMLKSGANAEMPDAKGYSPLHNAVKRHLLPIVKLLAKSGAVVDSKDPVDGYTPLILAIQGKNFEICEYLVRECSASLTFSDRFGKICLHYAARQSEVSIIQLLVESGANVNHEDEQRRTPLFEACEFDNEYALESLLRQNASMSHTDRNGSTPLHVAVEYGSVRCVRALIQHGADMRALDSRGRTPLIVASQSGSTLCGRMLVQAWEQVQKSGVVVLPRDLTPVLPPQTTTSIMPE